MKKNQQERRLRIEIEKNLRKIDFRFFTDHKEFHIGSLDEPLLLWDPERLSLFKEFDQIRQAIGNDTIILYDEVEIIWRREIWPPSIDSFFFVKTLRENGYLSRDFEVVADIGSGTGFIGIFLLKKNPRIEKLYASDIEEKAVYWSRKNAELNGVFSRMRFYQSDGFKELPKNLNVDLIVSTPPYIPTPENHQPQVFSCETKLLKEIYEKGNEYTKELVTMYSSVAEDDVKNFDKKYITKREILAEMKVPFRVPVVLGNQDWLDYLVENNGLEQRSKEEFLYPYWHRIIVERCNYE